jgi:hypothetical protein
MQDASCGFPPNKFDKASRQVYKVELPMVDDDDESNRVGLDG